MTLCGDYIVTELGYDIMSKFGNLTVSFPDIKPAELPVLEPVRMMSRPGKRTRAVQDPAYSAPPVTGATRSKKQKVPRTTTEKTSMVQLKN